MGERIDRLLNRLCCLLGVHEWAKIFDTGTGYSLYICRITGCRAGQTRRE